MYTEDELLPLSALQHYIYCPRQCALIHLEQQWAENRFTAEGRVQHSRVDRPEHETRDGVRFEYAVPLRSLRLGLIGRADVVEFHGDSAHLKSQISNFKSPAEYVSEISYSKSPKDSPSEISYLKSPADSPSEISYLKSLARVYPVEHKRGRPKPTHCDWIQLCAQAICLEEMMGVDIPEGAIFYGKPRRRQPVEFTKELRAETVATARALHQLIQEGITPPAEYEQKKCSACSLLEICMPQPHRSVAAYLKEVFREATS